MEFCVNFQVWQEIPEEGQRMHQSKHCEYGSKHEDNSSNALKDKNYKVSLKKF